jgi:1-acyl-sn-glycerol-3-phosphate acyltransferase
VARIAAAFGLFAVVAPVHILTKTMFRRSRWPTRFLAGVAWIFGARVKLEGVPARRHTLLVANHLSWFDIVVMGGATGCTFVAKDELGHPFIHWLADQNHTLYVKRTHRKGAKDQAVATAAALDGEQPVALFAEGTTGPGTHLLPFRSTLLEAANYASRDVEVRPVAIDYGAAATEVSWWEEPAMHNVFKLLGRPGTLPVTVHLLGPLDRSLDRKQLAQAARDAIARTLDLTLPEHSPIGGGE